MRKLSKAVPILLVLAMLVTLLAGCGGGGGGASEPGGKTPAAQETERPEFVYVAAYQTLDLGEEVNYLNSTCWAGDTLYFTTDMQTGTETYTDEMTGESWENPVYETVMASVKADGSDFKILENYSKPAIEEGMEGSSYINRMTVDTDGNVWVQETCYTYGFELPEGWEGTEEEKWEYYVDYGESSTVRQLDATGAEVASADLSYLKGDSQYFYINTMEIDGEGNIILTCDGSDKNGESISGLYVLDRNGTTLFKLSLENAWVNSFVRLPDGRVAGMYYDYNSTESVRQLRVIDVAAKDWGESYPSDMNYYNLYPGNSQYDYYCSDDQNFYGCDLKTGEATKIFNWINCDVDSNGLSAMTVLDDGRVLAVNTGGSGADPATEIITMTKTDSSLVPVKTTLTYACMYLDYNVRGQIISFNKANDTYRIEVKDYSEYNTEDDYQAGLTKLSTEILSGKVPDILDANSLPVDRYGAKGLLEDLWPYIDADTELGGRAGLVEPLFNALQTDDGKLYRIAPNFSVQTTIADSRLVGTESGWTLEDMYAALKQLPDGADIMSKGVTKQDILSTCCSMCLDDMVDWATGECRFNSQEFIDILNFANSFLDSFNWGDYDWETEYESEYSRFSSGKQLMAQFYLDSYQYMTMYEAIFDGNLTFIGFPASTGNGSAFSVNSGLAMASTCQYKDGAWEFMRTLLTPEYQEQFSWYGFPSNKSVFDEQMKTNMTPQYYTDPETGEKVEQSQGSWGMDDLQVEIYAMTQAQYDRIMELINGTTRIYAYDQSLYEIISDECAAFFSGQKTAEQTADLVQNRVSLYVNEQR